DQAVVTHAVAELRAQAQRQFAEAQQSAEENALELRDRGRERLQRATAHAQAVFLTQLALASQRPNVLPRALPPALVDAVRRFDGAVGGFLDAVAARATVADLRAPLAELGGVMQSQVGWIVDPEIAAHVEGRLALYRELVPRLEQLALAETGA